MTEQNVFSKIVLNNVRREGKLFSKFACRSIKGRRRDRAREKVPDRKNIRPIFAHDADKIIHSLTYTRYIDKAQVFYLFENDHITHRVLHVQFVSKIGRVIGRCLKLNEDLIEAISLGHDLGHVPFGHDGETILNELCEDAKIGYFCHNAQSVRFLDEIEQRGQGLNLSLQVLDGILAHNGELLDRKYEPQFGKTWDQFDEEYSRCFTEIDFSKQIRPMTLEGCVVRIADIIAYIGRDIEDAIHLKLIKRKEIPSEVTSIIGNSNDKIINALVLDLVKNSYGKNYLEFSRDIYKALSNLKRFNSDQIYFNPRIKTQTPKIHAMFRLLFDKYVEGLEKSDRQSAINQHFLKNMGENYHKNTHPKRKVIDFIAGMTDDYFNYQFEQLFVPQSYGYFVPSHRAARNFKIGS